MVKCVADLHLHSKYSRATSPDMELEGLSKWARIKGIDIVATGDFTHPKWVAELKKKCIERDDGFLDFNGMKFVLSAEIATIYSQGGKVRKVHHCLLAPSLEVVEQINERLAKRGNLEADGRPIIGMTSAALAEIVMGVSQKCMVIPAHVWTPWFGALGSKSGFDSIKECYEDMEKHIYALETGLSSDPAMNWRLSALDKYSLVSNSDSHSPAKMGREANVLDLPRITYEEMCDAIRTRKGFATTYEFFPEEGKYHVDGHRECGVTMSPEEAKKHNNICPVCKRPLTIGVLHRVAELADREDGFKPKGAVPFEHLIPLAEILGQVHQQGETTKPVQEDYFKLVKYFGNEFAVLHAPEDDLKFAAGETIASAIAGVRTGKVRVIPGYDGVYGKIELAGIARHEKESKSGKASKTEARKKPAQKTLEEF